MFAALSSSHALLSSFVLIFTALPAQQQPEAAMREPSELPFLQNAAKDLDAYATLAFKNGFPKRAHDLWIEVVAEYDGDDAVAREQLGFVRVGTAWQPKPDFEYPKVDEPNVTNAKMLESRWAQTARKLGDGHRELADQLQTGGKTERAQYHYKRALRFVPADQKVQVALGAKTVEGISGTPLDLELLRRSRLIDRLITKYTDTEYDSKPVDLKDERLDKGGVPYIAVQSEHFTIFGDWEPEVLAEAAQWAERSLAFCQDVFAGYEPWKTPPDVTPKFAFFKQRATWATVVRANAGAIGDDLEFVVKNTSATGIGRGKVGIHIAGQEGAETVFDFAIRKVAHDYARLGRDAMQEGIGHAVVGLFTGRNLITLVAQQKKEGTAVGKDYSRFQLPDMETWKDLAREIAFEKGTAPAAHLPLISAAFFTYEERIKSWSFCDYLLRRDPTLLVELNKTASKSKNDFDVMAAFQEATKLPLRGVEDDWRNFYTGDSAALVAIRNKVTPMQAVSKDAPIWLDELNRLRRIHQADAVGWSAELSTQCKQHADYLKQNKGERGYDRENTQVPGKPGFSNTGRLFAATAVVSTKEKDPRKAMETWIAMPGYRDVLLDRTLKTIGAYADGPILVLDVLRGREQKSFSPTLNYPYVNVKEDRHKDPLPASIPVDFLGPELVEELKKHGHGKLKEVGYPLSRHFFAADQGSVTCSVTIGGQEVPGMLVHSTQGSRRVAAPGLWVFYAYEPLHKGVDITIQWTNNGKTEKIIFQTT